MTVSDAETTAAPESEADLAQDAQTQEAPNVIYVHVCGAVRLAGVYELEEGARAFEAVAAAGGFTEDADVAYVNQAKRVSDGERLYLPTKEETANDVFAFERTIAANEREDASFGLVNINTASETELCTLTGIGPSRAKDIIRYRETHGAFQTIEDIMKVTGIKEKMFEKIRELITV